MKNDYQFIFDEFELQYPIIAEKTNGWYSSGQYEITIKLLDGRIFIYDFIDKTIRELNTFDGEEQYSSEEDWVKEFSKRFNRRVRLSGLTQKEISELTNISAQTLSRYSTGKGIPSAMNLSRLARALKCSPSEFVDFY